MPRGCLCGRPGQGHFYRADHLGLGSNEMEERRWVGDIESAQSSSWVKLAKLSFR